MDDRQVCPKRPSKSDVSGALAVGWARASRSVGKGALADHIDASTKTIDRALTGETVPELHTALASLFADESSLDEVFALYGRGRPPRLQSAAANDLATVSDLSGVVSAFCAAIKDGTRDHQETLMLADLIRTVMPALTDIMEDGNRIKGVAAS